MGDLINQAGNPAQGVEFHRVAARLDPAGLEMITTGPVSKPLGPDPSGIRVVIWNDDRIEHQDYGLGSIPHEVPARK